MQALSHPQLPHSIQGDLEVSSLCWRGKVLKSERALCHLAPPYQSTDENPIDAAAPAAAVSIETVAAPVSIVPAWGPDEW